MSATRAFVRRTSSTVARRIDSSCEPASTTTDPCSATAKRDRGTLRPHRTPRVSRLAPDPQLAHLEHVLRVFVHHYNSHRAHRSLNLWRPARRRQRVAWRDSAAATRAGVGIDSAGSSTHHARGMRAEFSVGARAPDSSRRLGQGFVRITAPEERPVTVRTPAEHRYASPGSSLSLGVRGRGLIVRPWGLAGIGSPPVPYSE